MFSDRILLLDGGLGSSLSERGYKIQNDPLWSARIVHSNPSAIIEAHKEFLDKGADILISSSYQMSIEGLKNHLNLNTEESEALIMETIKLAKTSNSADNKDVMVAGSIGPYGACQGDGSEYSGLYCEGMSQEELMEWHRPRMRNLVKAGADFLAVETIPALKEAIAVIRLLREFPGTKAWLTFSCKDGVFLNNGDNIGETVSSVFKSDSDHSLIGIGVNCTHPSNVSSLLGHINAAGAPPSPLMPRVVYPNSGEHWLPGVGFRGEVTKDWPVHDWLALGANLIGGCCRVTAQDIERLRGTLDNWQAQDL